MHFLELPNEVIAAVLRHCEDVTDLFSFAQSCKRIYSVWSDISDQASVLYEVGSRGITAFEYALLAVSN
jgi:hypothetical protein